jgi:hypothetical protein
LLVSQRIRFPHIAAFFCRYDAQDSGPDDAQAAHRGNVTLPLNSQTRAQVKRQTLFSLKRCHRLRTSHLAALRRPSACHFLCQRLPLEMFIRCKGTAGACRIPEVHVVQCFLTRLSQRLGCGGPAHESSTSEKQQVHSNLNHLGHFYGMMISTLCVSSRAILTYSSHPVIVP